MAVRDAFRKLYNSLLQKRVAHVQTHTHTGKVVIGTALGLLVMGSFFGYRWYVVHREEQAQAVFASCIREYERAEQDPSAWPNIELIFRLGYEQHSSSSIAPYFLAFQAEALIQQGKLDEAREVMQRSVAQLSSRSPLYSLYATKHALLMIDAQDEKISQEGLATLEGLAQNTKNIQRDMALYHLGLYHWSHDDLNKAREVWRELAPLAQADPASPWARLAVEKMEQIAA